MPYLDAVIKEVMRHHPPVNVLIRGINGEDLHLTCEAGKIGHDGKSYMIPRGARCMVDIIGLHKDPRYWRNAHVFDPSRFLVGDPDFEEVEIGSYIPFGGGPRTCIGNMFGLLEVKLALVQLLRSYTFDSTGEPITVKPGEEQKPATGATLRMEPHVDAPESGRGVTAAGANHMDPCPILRSQTFQVRSRSRCVCFRLEPRNLPGLCGQLAAAWPYLVGDESSSSAIPLDALDVSQLVDPARAPTCLLLCVSTTVHLPRMHGHLWPPFVSCCASSTRDADDASPVRAPSVQRVRFGQQQLGSTFQQIPDELNRAFRDLGAHPIYPMAVADAAEAPQARRLWRFG